MNNQLEAYILYSSLFDEKVDQLAKGIQLALADRCNITSPIKNWHPFLEVTDVMNCLNAKVKIIIMTELLAEQFDYVLNQSFEFQDDDQYKLKWILGRYLTDAQLKDSLIGIYYDGPKQYDWLSGDHVVKHQSTSEFFKLMDKILKK